MSSKRCAAVRLRCRADPSKDTELREDSGTPASVETTSTSSDDSSGNAGLAASAVAVGAGLFLVSR